MKRDLLCLTPTRMFWKSEIVKRCIDIILSLLILAISWPAVLIAMVLVCFAMGWPVFFVQIRPGLKGRPFHLYKLRTMKFASDGRGNFLSDEQRLTILGNWLRKMSVDELPQLFNVLKGDMSLVGPRPLLMEYLPLYSPEQRRRHDVRPGITGWAQINGRNALSWEEKFALDVWYVDNRSLCLDLKILLLTIRKVVMREGISAQGEATMPRFTGTPQEDTP